MPVAHLDYRADDALSLTLGDGTVRAHNMGCDVVIVDQADELTKSLQRVVLTKADLEALLAWLQ